MWLFRRSPRHPISATRNPARRVSIRSRRLEALEPRTLLSSLPFDDAGLAPAGLAAQCALPNLPVFNVESYGAVPNSAANQTPSIRAALSAAEAAGGGIIYLPAGTYNVANLTSDASITGSIFTITGSNIVFIGDHNAATGASETFLDGWCMSSNGQMKNPTTFWYDISGGQIGRFSMFGLPDAVSNVQFRSLVINGQAAWTGNYTVGGVQSSGDGWDLTNKCIMIGAAEVDDVLVFNCSIENWRGEEIYAGGADQTPIDIIKDTLTSSDADGVSAGNVFLAYTTIGGTTAGSDLCNGVEDFALSAPEKTTIENCTIEISSNPNDLHGNGVAILGQPGTSFTIVNSVLDNNQCGILFSEFDHDVTVFNDSFENTSYAMMTSILDQYPGYPQGFSDFTISGNTFNNLGCAFLSQSYGSDPAFPDLVLQGNTVTNGSLLGGAFNSPTPDSWTGFAVENNTIGAGATDVSQYSGGNNFAVWTNTIRTNPAPPVPLMSAGDWVEDSSNETTTSFVPETDLTVLDYNQTSGTQYAELGVPVASYPPGYRTQIVSANDDNWVLKADPAWNNFSANQPVGPNGLWIGINARGLFTLLPVLSGIEGAPLAYLEGAPATVLTAAITLSDPDSTTLTGATIQISGNYQRGGDVLSFTNTGKITGDWNAATGTLTLSGSDTLADYQAALRSVTYLDTSLNPSNATRTVSFQVDDGLVGSNVVTRQFMVTPVAAWNGSATGNLSDPTKWVAGVAPKPAVDDLVLGGPTASSPVNDFPAGSAFQGLVFNGNCTLSGNSVLLDSTILNAQGNNSVSLPLVLDDAGLVQVSSGSLAVGGTINNSGHLLTVNTAASTTAAFSGSISGSGGLVKSGTGTLVLTARNGYSGGTTVLAGVLQVAAPGAIAPGAALTVGSGAVVVLGSSSA